MILSDIKAYFSERSAASIADLSMHFNVDPEAMRGMLDQWIRKGKLRRLPEAASCPGCCDKCGSEQSEIYEWIR